MCDFTSCDGYQSVTVFLCSLFKCGCVTVRAYFLYIYRSIYIYIELSFGQC